MEISYNTHISARVGRTGACYEAMSELTYVLEWPPKSNEPLQNRVNDSVRPRSNLGAIVMSI